VAVVNFLQFHTMPQLVDHLNPKPRLKQSDNSRLVLCTKNVSVSTNLGVADNKGINVLINDLFSDNPNSSDYIALNDRMNIEYKIGRHVKSIYWLYYEIKF
jgi:hypothetical protein